MTLVLRIPKGSPLTHAVDVMSYVVSADATFAICVMLGDVK